MMDTIRDDISKKKNNPKLIGSDKLCSTITIDDLRTLKPSSWLNDEVYIMSVVGSLKQIANLILGF